jgi:Stage II sporulation protein
MKLPTFFVCGWMLILAGTSLSAAQVHGPSRHFVAPPAGPKIKVLLEKDTPSAFLEARGPYRVVRKDSGTVLSSGTVGKRFVVHALQDGLRWGEEYPDVYQISVLPLTRDACLFVNGIQYKGAVSIYHVRNSRITIVNEVAIEDYLKATLAVQYDEALTKEAMAALAIAARTEAYSKALQGASTTRPWDIAAHEADYYGLGVTQRKNGVDDAVDWTRYMVLESLKQQGPAQNVQLSSTKADELAKKGFDAQKILKTAFPHTKIGATISPDEVAVR